MAKNLEQVSTWKDGGRASASDFNAVAHATRAVFGSLLSDGFIDSSGVHLRRQAFRRAGLLFVVNLASTGGSAGNATTQCSYVYTVTDLAGTSLGTGQSPEMGRPAKGALVAATKGIGYYSQAGAFTLLSAFEVQDVEACS